MYKDWIDEVLSTEKLPDYMYSPFAQQEAYQSDGNAENNAAIVPTIQGTAILMTFLPVIISTFTWTRPTQATFPMKIKTNNSNEEHK